jgi:hypothetical protein
MKSSKMPQKVESGMTMKGRKRSHSESKMTMKGWIAFTMLLAINLLFVYKYTARVTDLAGYVTALLGAFYISVWTFRGKIPVSGKQFMLAAYVTLVIFAGLSMLVFSRVPVESLNVDRWSVITSFWETFFDSRYPYFAESNVGNPPGPMPFYFILALPFYYAGELGLLSLMGLMLFIAVIIRSKAHINNKLGTLIIMVTSLFYLWEIVVRSNVFLNSTLVLLVLIWFAALDKKPGPGFFANAFCGGLLLATRSVFIIPYIIFLVYALRMGMISFRNLVLYGLTGLVAFAITFLPFVINHFDDFLVINPFVIQSTFLVPFHYTAGFLLLAALAAFLCRSKADTFLYSGIVLFVSIAVYFLYHTALSGLHAAYIESIVDISYFIFATPFLLYYLLKYSSKFPVRRSSKSG